MEVCFADFALTLATWYGITALKMKLSGHFSFRSCIKSSYHCSVLALARIYSPRHQLILGQKVQGQGHRVKKCKKSRRRAAPCHCDVKPNGRRRELHWSAHAASSCWLSYFNWGLLSNIILRWTATFQIS